MKGTSPTRSGCWPARHRSAKIEFALFNLITRGEVMDKITTVGIDLAKSVFSLHGVDGAGRVVLKRTVRRDKLMEAVALDPGAAAAPGLLPNSGGESPTRTRASPGRCWPRTKRCARSEYQRLPRLPSTMTKRPHRRPQNLIKNDGGN